MEPNRLLNTIITRLRDQRFLFSLGAIIVVAGLAPFHLIASMAILGSAVVIVMVDRILPGRGPEGSKSEGLNLRVALDFEGVDEGTAVRLERRTRCTIQDPRNPGQSTMSEVLLHEGPGGKGWLCPIPMEAGPNDLVSFTFNAFDGSQWELTVMPDLLWPKQTANRVT